MMEDCFGYVTYNYPWLEGNAMSFHIIMFIGELS